MSSFTNESCQIVDRNNQIFVETITKSIDELKEEIRYIRVDLKEQNRINEERYIALTSKSDKSDNEIERRLLVLETNSKTSTLLTKWILGGIGALVLALVPVIDNHYRDSQVSQLLTPNDIETVNGEKSQHNKGISPILTKSIS